MTLSIIVSSVIMVNVIILSVAFFIDVLSVVMLSDIMLSVVMLSVIRLSVVAPCLSLHDLLVNHFVFMPVTLLTLRVNKHRLSLHTFVA